MAFRLDLATGIFLGLGAALVVAAGITMTQAPSVAVYPLALGGAFLLAGAAMGYEGRE